MIRAVSWTSMSGAVSHAFFFRELPHARSACPLLLSFWRVIRYHLGSMAFGSLLVALVQLARLVLEWAAQQASLVRLSAPLSAPLIATATSRAGPKWTGTGL